MHINALQPPAWLRERLQAVAAFYYVFLFVITPVLSVYLTVKIALSTYWWILGIYSLWVLYDFRTPEKGARPADWMRNNFVWNYFADYFPIRLVKTAELSQCHNYVIGSHPHGILSFAAFATFCTDGTGFSTLFPGIERYLATLNGQFWFPFRRDPLMFTGAIAASEESLNYVLSAGKGRAVGIVLGGAEEVFDTNPGNFDLNLSNRKGFVRIAFRHGAHLVPMYHFGENETYSQLIPNSRGSRIRAVQRAIKKYCGFCPPLINGCGMLRGILGLLPRRTPINTVVGKSIPVEKNLNPSQSEIDSLHKEYCDQLKTLFEDHKIKFGIPKDVFLTIY